MLLNKQKAASRWSLW